MAFYKETRVLTVVQIEDKGVVAPERRKCRTTFAPKKKRDETTKIQDFTLKTHWN